MCRSPASCVAPQQDQRDAPPAAIAALSHADLTRNGSVEFLARSAGYVAGLPFRVGSSWRRRKREAAGCHESDHRQPDGRIPETSLHRSEHSIFLSGKSVSCGAVIPTGPGICHHNGGGWCRSSSSLVVILHCQWFRFGCCYDHAGEACRSTGSDGRVEGQRGMLWRSSC
jgi:hypothetical protein